MKAKILGLVIAGAGCMAALPAYASLTGSITIVPETRHFGTSDFQRIYNHGWKDPYPMPAAAPEVDPASAAAALTLLAGGLAFLRGRRRKD